MSHPPWSYDLAGSASPKLGANPNWWGKLRVLRAARPSTTPRDPRDSKFTPARVPAMCPTPARSEEHTSELQSRPHLVCRLLLEKKKNNQITRSRIYRLSVSNFCSQLDLQ